LILHGLRGDLVHLRLQGRDLRLGLIHLLLQTLLRRGVASPAGLFWSMSIVPACWRWRLHAAVRSDGQLKDLRRPNLLRLSAIATG
jgi:hypothetical protein